jgi:hypothetical protein
MFPHRCCNFIFTSNHNIFPYTDTHTTSQSSPTIKPPSSSATPPPPPRSSPRRPAPASTETHHSHRLVTPRHQPSATSRPRHPAPQTHRTRSPHRCRVPLLAEKHGCQARSRADGRSGGRCAAFEWCRSRRRARRGSGLCGRACGWWVLDGF